MKISFFLLLDTTVREFDKRFEKKTLNVISSMGNLLIWISQKEQQKNFVRDICGFSRRAGIRNMVAAKR
jgi:hypothetical protein